MEETIQNPQLPSPNLSPQPVEESKSSLDTIGAKAGLAGGLGAGLVRSFNKRKTIGKGAITTLGSGALMSGLGYIAGNIGDSALSKLSNLREIKGDDNMSDLLQAAYMAKLAANPVPAGTYRGGEGPVVPRRGPLGQGQGPVVPDGTRGQGPVTPPREAAPGGQGPVTPQGPNLAERAYATAKRKGSYGLSYVKANPKAIGAGAAAAAAAAAGVYAMTRNNEQEKAAAVFTDDKDAGRRGAMINGGASGLYGAAMGGMMGGPIGAVAGGALGAASGAGAGYLHGRYIYGQQDDPSAFSPAQRGALLSGIPGALTGAVAGGIMGHGLKGTAGAIGGALAGGALTGALSAGSGALYGNIVGGKKKEASYVDEPSYEEVLMAKMAAEEMYAECVEKLAFAEQLFEEADFLQGGYEKLAADNGSGEPVTWVDQLRTPVGATMTGAAAAAGLVGGALLARGRGATAMGMGGAAVAGGLLGAGTAAAGLGAVHAFTEQHRQARAAQYQATPGM